MVSGAKKLEIQLKLKRDLCGSDLEKTANSQQ
jgi:hypothetical protein